MRTKFFAGFLLFVAFAGGASAAVVVEKMSRQLPYVEVFGCQGIHSFIFRGPTGTSRRAILVPPREYWTAQEAGLYKFVVRYSSGNVCSRLVTPEVFARYQVGDHFYDRPATRDQYQPSDSKSAESAAPHRHTFAQAWPNSRSRRRSGRRRKIARLEDRIEPRRAWAPGSAGCQPALFGSLPKRTPMPGLQRFHDVAGRLPATAG